jgi:phosphorylcholine metabolism protein LicD/GR25 family glycosyltransferase involved in LPS biosynthesis
MIKKIFILKKNNIINTNLEKKKKLEEQKRLERKRSEEEKRLEEQKKIIEQKILKKEKFKKQQRLELKRLMEQERLKKEKILLEQKRLEEEKILEELKKTEIRRLEKNKLKEQERLNTHNLDTNNFYYINTKEYNDIKLNVSEQELINLKKSQKIMTSMLKSFDLICRKYNLKYWCVGGTFIGAIRHQGWIPYDGDVDIAMLDTDYEIFRSKANELPSNMWLQYTDNDPLYKINLRKIRHLFSYYTDYPPRDSHTGLQIDIFLYKKVDNDLISLADRYFTIPDIGDMEYDEIFPLSEGNFEDIKVYLPNNYEQFSRRYWRNYPPSLLPLKMRRPREGNMRANNTRKEDIKLYPHIYNSLKEWEILIILIDELNDRKIHVLNLIEKFKKLNIKARIVSAYYWKVHNIKKSLKDNNITTNINYMKYDKIKGQICCFLSHMKAWKYIANSDENKNYIILEDDVDISENFNLEHITNMFKYIPEYDLVNFWRHPYNLYNQKNYIYNQFFSNYYYNYGTCSYTVSKKFANELIKIKSYSIPLDNTLIGYINHNKCYITLEDYFINIGGSGAKVGILESSIAY